MWAARRVVLDVAACSHSGGVPGCCHAWSEARKGGAEPVVRSASFPDSAPDGVAEVAFVRSRRDCVGPFPLPGDFRKGTTLTTGFVRLRRTSPVATARRPIRGEQRRQQVRCSFPLIASPFSTYA